MNKFNVIKTDRLLIRTLELKDRDAFFKYRSMPEVFTYQAWRPEHISEIEKFITANMTVELNTKNAWLQLAVCLRNGQLIGDVGIHFMDDDYQAGIGYTLSPEFQGQGYACEAVKAVVDYLFSVLKKHRITASIDPDNTKSIKLLEKIGFRKEAHFIQSFRLNGQWYDDCIYAMLADEWR